MSAAVTLAQPEHMAALLALMARRKAEGEGREDTDQEALDRQHAVKPLLAGGPEGAVWIIGPPKAPLGYVIVTFGYCVTMGAREAWIEDVYVRPNVRRRGIGREVMHAIHVSLRQAGLSALHVRLPVADDIATAFCASAGFASQPQVVVMTDVLARPLSAG